MIYHHNNAEGLPLPRAWKAALLPATMHCRGARPPREQAKPAQPKAASAPEEGEGLVEDGSSTAAADKRIAATSLLATAFAPVNTLTWEDRVCWQGAPTGAESEHETDDEQEAAGTAAAAPRLPAEGEAAWGQAEQQQVADGAAGLQQQAFGEPQQQLGSDEHQWNQPPLDVQQQEHVAQPDIAAMFAQHPPAAQQTLLGGMSFENGLPMNGDPFVPGGTAAAAGPMQPQSGQWGQHQPDMSAWPGQQTGQPFGAFPAASLPAAIADHQPPELPGLSGASAAELEARAAAESDEEDYFALPTAPLLRLELLTLSASGGEDGQHGFKRLQAAPDMLPGALVSSECSQNDCWQLNGVGSINPSACSCCAFAYRWGKRTAFR